MSSSFFRAMSIGALAYVAGSANAVQFLVTDGAKLWRADSTGFVAPPVTLSAQVQSLTALPSGYTLSGASTGDVLCSARTATSGRWNIYRMDDPFGTPTLTVIGSTNHGIGSLAFAGGKMYGVDDTLGPLRIYEIDMVSGNSTATHNTGIPANGGGGLAHAAGSTNFYVTDATANALYSWTGSGAATLVGPAGVGFVNNGLDYYNGILYGGLRLDSAGSTIRIGQFNIATGQFTGIVDVTGAVGNGTGFYAVPEPTTLVALGLALVGLTQRRRKS